MKGKIYDELCSNGEVMAAEAEVHISNKGMRIYDVRIEMEYRAPSLDNASIGTKYSFSANMATSNKITKDLKSLPSWVVVNALDEAIAKLATANGLEGVLYASRPSKEVSDAFIRTILGKGTAEDVETLKPFKGEA